MIILKCDSCGEVIDKTTTGPTVTSIRLWAKKIGWHHDRKTGTDSCDDCTWEQHHAIDGKLTTCKTKP